MIAIMNALEPLGVHGTGHAGDRGSGLAGNTDGRSTGAGVERVKVTVKVEVEVKV